MLDQSLGLLLKKEKDAKSKSAKENLKCALIN